MGCELAPTVDEVVDKPLAYEEAKLGPQALADRMEEIDSSYAEPRTPSKVQYSYETALASISRENGYDALWRGARACAWIGLNDPDRSRRVEYAKKGILMGKEAIRRTSTKVESHYYYALSLGALADTQRNQVDRNFVRQMRDEVVIAKAIDESYDHCGPLRFLGQMMVETDGYHIWQVGSMEQGQELLKRATELCPDFGENHLAYAKALIKDELPDKARAPLEKVLACPRPKDYSAEHEAWLEEATSLLTDLGLSS
jgi:hypothetical protein